jgi:putative Na+/H+ antiporter
MGGRAFVLQCVCPENINAAAMSPTSMEILATLLFAVAVLHTFLTRHFEHLAHVQPAHAGFWHLLGEVEVVFGFWAAVFLVALTASTGMDGAIAYLDTVNVTEAEFVFVVMVIAASRPIFELAGLLTRGVARLLPLPTPLAFYFAVLAFLPLLGSFITEPAAMTLAALVLRDNFFARPLSERFKYATLGVLFVNVSIGGTLTSFAAPPVLIVATKWGWDLPFMLTTFGWKAAIAVLLNTTLATLLLRRELRGLDVAPAVPAAGQAERVPALVIAIHLIFLAGVVVFSHYPKVFTWIFLFFLGFVSAYARYQSPLILREGLLVGFFLMGLVTLGGQQAWWLQPLLGGLSDTVVFFGALGLTALTDNAALTYLGSLVEGTTAAFKYALVAGAVAGGGLTVIANAPNPAGFSILRGSFAEGAISPLGLLLAALGPTIVAVAAFLLV